MNIAAKIIALKEEQLRLQTFTNELIERLKSTELAAEHQKQKSLGTEYARNIGYIEAIKDSIKLLKAKTDLEIGRMRLKIYRLEDILDDQSFDMAFEQVKLGSPDAPILDQLDPETRDYLISRVAKERKDFTNVLVEAEEFRRSLKRE